MLDVRALKAQALNVNQIQKDSIDALASNRGSKMAGIVRWSSSINCQLTCKSRFDPKIRDFTEEVLKIFLLMFAVHPDSNIRRYCMSESRFGMTASFHSFASKTRNRWTVRAWLGELCLSSRRTFIWQSSEANNSHLFGLVCWKHCRSIRDLVSGEFP